jgi:diaminohydroxyphosphoribosylaminopyrimidine deaminase/5-amino-6-(5-phosphoribosylamino)uracil reductase
MGAAVTPLSATDRRLLRETISLAALGARDVHPNPRVGAIVIAHGSSDAIVGRGHHRRYGGEHAEPQALDEAGDLARGGTLYCSLEPCSFEAADKHQPPCTQAVIAARVARVVIGRIDRHPRVDGDGVRQLRAAGIDVDIAPDPMPFWLADPVPPTVTSLGRPLIHAVTSASLIATDRSAIVHDEAATPETVHLVDPSARSVLLRCEKHESVSLPGAWQVDFLDGRPTSAWCRAMRTSTNAMAAPARY